MEAFTLLFDAAVVLVVLGIARHLRRRPAPLDNWRPSEDDARSGRRVTLFTRPRNWRSR